MDKLDKETSEVAHCSLNERQQKLNEIKRNMIGNSQFSP